MAFAWLVNGTSGGGGFPEEAWKLARNPCIHNGNNPNSLPVAQIFLVPGEVEVASGVLWMVVESVAEV